MGIDWRKWFGLPSKEDYMYTEYGVPICACQHPKNEHISTCWARGCYCTDFFHAKKPIQ